MEIKLKQQNAAVHFTAENESGSIAHFDGSEEIGGEGKGLRPMEMLLSSVAACASFDVVSILQKQREPLKDVQVSAKGERLDHAQVKPFKSIHLQFTLLGALDRQKAERAVALAVEKYCSVASSLHPDIILTHSLNIQPA